MQLPHVLDELLPADLQLPANVQLLVMQLPIVQLLVMLLAFLQLKLPFLGQLQVQEVRCSTNRQRQSAGDDPALSGR
jgi:hypothetical protein